MGAVLGMRLTTRISNVMNLNMNQLTYRSDSLNVLWWIRGRSREFKPFIANKIGEIQSRTNQEQWRYVPTSLNPANILSRGMSAVMLSDCDKWWKGPEFLRQPEEGWPARKYKTNPQDKTN